MKIAVFTKNRSNAAYAGARLGAERAAARLGASVEHYVPERPDDVEQQIELIDHAIAARPDAVVLVPVHPTAVNPAIGRINAARIPIVSCINRLTVPGAVSFVGSDDHALAVAIAGYLFDRLGGEGSVVILEGPPGSSTGSERERGFHDAARSCPGVRIVASRSGRYLQEPGREAMDELLRQVPHIDGVLAANDAMALGAIEALRRAGRRPLMAGINAVPEAIAAIKRGELLATVDFSAMHMACLAAECAIRHLRGEAVPEEIILPAVIVDHSNLAEWDMPYEQRTCLRWDDVVRPGGAR